VSRWLAVLVLPLSLGAQSRIDELVLDRLRQLNIQPAPLSTDAVFLRRAYLDTIGTLPTAVEARRFLEDRNPDKRRALIDALLEREEFADYWAMKWSDLLRVKAEFPINLWPNAARAYHHWILASIRENKPYDQFVRELLTASGSNFRDPAVNFYRALQSREPAAITQAVALTFMGTRTPQADLEAYFSRISYKQTGEWKEEIVFFKLNAPNERDPRAAFADWLIRPENPWFARNIVNRIWYWLLGRGIIHEPDDIRADNPPADPELLGYLQNELVAARYDLKHIFRLILNSHTYQLAFTGPENFASYHLRRLDAEVLADALCQVTGTGEEYTSAIPEPFAYIPASRRSISLPDGSISSPFLELFGRPPRDTGLESERNNRITAAQRLHLLNSTHVQRKLRQGTVMQAIFQNNKEPLAVVNEIYLTVLSRLPNPEELKAVGTYSQTGPVRGREALFDLAWALINSDEFLFRH